MTVTLGEFLEEERKQAINREWKYLTPLQRGIIFLRFALGVVPRLVISAHHRRIQYRRARFAHRYPAHWIGT